MPAKFSKHRPITDKRWTLLNNFGKSKQTFNFFAAALALNNCHFQAVGHLLVFGPADRIFKPTYELLIKWPTSIFAYEASGCKGESTPSEYALKLYSFGGFVEGGGGLEDHPPLTTLLTVAGQKSGSANVHMTWLLLILLLSLVKLVAKSNF